MDLVKVRDFLKKRFLIHYFYDIFEMERSRNCQYEEDGTSRGRPFS